MQPRSNSDPFAVLTLDLLGAETFEVVSATGCLPFHCKRLHLHVGLATDFMSQFSG